MKATMRSLIFVVLAVAGGMALLAGNAQGAEDAMPPEVKALIGMRIPDTETGRNGEIPNWTMNGGEVFRISTDGASGSMISGYFQNNLSIFVVEERNNKEKYRTILDAQLLPIEFLTYYLKNGKAVTKKQWWKFYVPTVLCYRERGETIVGLMRPERGKYDCSHKTKQIKRAWKINQETGHIAETSPQEVSCSYMGGEYSCDPE